MIKTTKFAAVTALALVLGAPAVLAQGQNQTAPGQDQTATEQNGTANVPSLMEIERTVMVRSPTPIEPNVIQNLNTSLQDAIGTAENNTNAKNSNSKAFAASFADVNGTPLYRVATANDLSIYQVQIDAHTGKPIGLAKIFPTGELTPADRAMLANLPNANTSLSDAIGNATGKLGGHAVGAILTRRNGALAYDVTVVNKNGMLQQALVNEANGNVAELPAGNAGYGSSQSR